MYLVRRQEIGENVHIYLIGKEETRTHSLAVSLHCDEDDAISVSGQNSLCHQITAACKHGGDLYVVGGSIPRRMWKCNMHTMDWERCAPLPRDRLHHTMVSVSTEDAIYSLGGKTLQDTLSNAVIYYTVKDNMWTETSQLDTAVSGAAGVNLGGTIYLLGGEENDMDFFTKPSRLIQCFDTSSQKCQIKPYMLPFAGCMHAAVHMDVIFIVAEGDSLVCYNPLLESFTRLRFPEVWSCVPSLWKVASCNGCIYVFRDKCKKGDANTLKFNPATSVVSVIRGIKILLTNWQFVLAWTVLRMFALLFPNWTQNQGRLSDSLTMTSLSRHPARGPAVNVFIQLVSVSLIPFWLQHPTGDNGAVWVCVTCLY